jgi:hypothetical protein
LLTITADLFWCYIKQIMNNYFHLCNIVVFSTHGSHIELHE